MMSARPKVCLALGALWLFACGNAVQENTSAPDMAVEVIAPGQTGLPCEVQILLESRCNTGCHSDPPQMAALMPLVTLADLRKASRTDPTQSNGQRAVIRIQAIDKPMPPPPAQALSATDIATLKGWVEAGMPSAVCAQPSPFAADPTCTSMDTWTLGTRGSADMEPGMACIACHRKLRGPDLFIGGTVFPSAHEPDACNGTLPDDPNGATVLITGADGHMLPLDVSSTSGNFYQATRFGTVKLPYTAKVVFQGRERIMNSPQTVGDCNSCHTQDGTKSAPGRIVLP